MPGGISPPPEVVMSWPHPSDNPVRRDWGYAIGVIVLWAGTTVIVAARLIARCFIQKNHGLDDLLILIAMIFLTGLAGCITAGAHWLYFDRHVWDLTPSQAVTSRKLVLAEYILYIVATSATKISILLFYRRMSAGTLNKGFHWALRICIATVIGYLISTPVGLLLSCQPLNSFWLRVNTVWLMQHEEGNDWHCYDESAHLMAVTSISLAHDFIVCLLPIILFWKLQLPRRQKLALMGVFVLGGITCVCACVRMYYNWQIFFGTYDTTWVTGPAWLWVALEAHLGVVAASLPALKIYFPKHFLSSTINSSRNWRRRAYNSSKQVGLGSTDSQNMVLQRLEHGNENKIVVTRKIELDSESALDVPHYHEHKENFGRSGSIEDLKGSSFSGSALSSPKQTSRHYAGAEGNAMPDFHEWNFNQTSSFRR